MDVYIRSFYSKLHERLSEKYNDFYNSNNIRNASKNIENMYKRFSIFYERYLESTGKYNDINLFNGFVLKYEDRKLMTLLMSILMVRFRKRGIIKGLLSFIPSYMLCSIILCRENFYP